MGAQVKTPSLWFSSPNGGAQDGDGGGEGTGKDELRREAERCCVAETGVTSNSHGIEERTARRDRGRSKPGTCSCGLRSPHYPQQRSRERLAVSCQSLQARAKQVTLFPEGSRAPDATSQTPTKMWVP